MKQIIFRNNIAARFKDVFKISTRMILLCSIILLIDSDGIIESQSAHANVQYGIQGQQAPKLNLTTWIDGDGKQIDPIKLSNFRGKVIYLYFFQDW